MWRGKKKKKKIIYPVTHSVFSWGTLQRQPVVAVDSHQSRGLISAGLVGLCRKSSRDSTVGVGSLDTSVVKLPRVWMDGARPYDLPPRDTRRWSYVSEPVRYVDEYVSRLPRLPCFVFRGFAAVEWRASV